MDPIEIIVIIASVLIVGGVIGNYFYKKHKHLPTGECSYCYSKGKHKKNRLLDDYHKKYGCKNCNQTENKK